MASPSPFPAPRRIIASNLPLPHSSTTTDNAEPGVQVTIDTLVPEPIFGGTLVRSRVATSTAVPTSNDGSGDIPLDKVPGHGIVLPGGLNMYYLDVAPRTEGTMHRTTSTDYVVVLNGTLSLLTPSEQPYTVVDGKGTYGEPVETLCKTGEVVIQRGMMHALSNRTDEWVRFLGVVAGSQPNRVPVAGTNGGAEGVKVLEDVFLS